jgi:hypothetical protein
MEMSAISAKFLFLIIATSFMAWIEIIVSIHFFFFCQAGRLTYPD